MDPDGFYARQADDLEMRRSVLVVTLTGLATMAGPLYLIERLVSATDQVVAVFYAFGGLFGTFTSGLTILLFWLAYSILFFLVGRRLGGVGEFRVVFFLTGFGFLPQFFAGIGSLFALYTVLSGLTIASDPAALQAQFDAVNGNPTVRTARLVGITFLLWRGFIWTFAVRHALDLDLRRAAVPAAIPTVASVGWELSQLLA